MKLQKLGWTLKIGKGDEQKTCSTKVHMLKKLQQNKLSRDMPFPTMWHFDKYRLRLASTASF